MPPKRNLTPKQLSNSLSYVQKEAPFLARLKNQNQEKEKAARKFENYEDGQDDDDYNELDGAQVVELDAKGREIFKKQDEDEEKEEKEEESKEPEAPAVDENGRLLFRKQTTSTKRKLQSIIDEEIKKSDKPSLKSKKKKTKSKPTSSLLSFEQDDE
ncbi:unnamed protein product [Mucor circinelloides]|uniref:DUF4604 domain-containing protein n=1 Tax=Mucor circinelloides f. circinelloides (strain 1006PhL) TaxID=1220926 RepID=S2J404_MUCC1|nr:hypothetical protein HMPREF1544_08363 [Mucor circinelloides 1006PhL]